MSDQFQPQNEEVTNVFPPTSDDATIEHTTTPETHTQTNEHTPTNPNGGVAVFTWSKITNTINQALTVLIKKSTAMLDWLLTQLRKLPCCLLLVLLTMLFGLLAVILLILWYLFGGTSERTVEVTSRVTISRVEAVSKLDVYSAQIADYVRILDSGLQVIYVYKGESVLTVDLAQAKVEYFQAPPPIVIQSQADNEQAHAKTEAEAVAPHPSLVAVSGKVATTDPLSTQEIKKIVVTLPGLLVESAKLDTRSGQCFFAKKQYPDLGLKKKALESWNTMWGDDEDRNKREAFKSRAEQEIRAYAQVDLAIKSYRAEYLTEARKTAESLIKNFYTPFGVEVEVRWATPEDAVPVKLYTELDLAEKKYKQTIFELVDEGLKYKDAREWTEREKKLHPTRYWLQRREVLDELPRAEWTYEEKLHAPGIYWEVVYDEFDEVHDKIEDALSQQARETSRLSRQREELREKQSKSRERLSKLQWGRSVRDPYPVTIIFEEGWFVDQKTTYYSERELNADIQACKIEIETYDQDVDDINTALAQIAQTRRQDTTLRNRMATLMALIKSHEARMKSSLNISKQVEAFDKMILEHETALQGNSD